LIPLFWTLIRVLFRIIGEDKTLSIKVGVEAGDPSTQDVIVIRGPSSDVDNAVQRIYRIVEEAKNDEIVNSYVRLRGLCTYFSSDTFFSLQNSTLTKSMLGVLLVHKAQASTNSENNLVSKWMSLTTLMTRRLSQGKRRKVSTKSPRLK